MVDNTSKSINSSDKKSRKKSTKAPTVNTTKILTKKESQKAFGEMLKRSRETGDRLAAAALNARKDKTIEVKVGPNEKVVLNRTIYNANVLADIKGTHTENEQSKVWTDYTNQKAMEEVVDDVIKRKAEAAATNNKSETVKNESNNKSDSSNKSISDSSNKSSESIKDKSISEDKGKIMESNVNNFYENSIETSNTSKEKSINKEKGDQIEEILSNIYKEKMEEAEINFAKLTSNIIQENLKTLEEMKEMHEKEKSINGCIEKFLSSEYNKNKEGSLLSKMDLSALIKNGESLDEEDEITRKNEELERELFGILNAELVKKNMEKAIASIDSIKNLIYSQSEESSSSEHSSTVSSRTRDVIESRKGELTNAIKSAGDSVGKLLTLLEEIENVSQAADEIILNNVLTEINNDKSNSSKLREESKEKKESPLLVRSVKFDLESSETKSEKMKSAFKSKIVLPYSNRNVGTSILNSNQSESFDINTEDTISISETLDSKAVDLESSSDSSITPSFVEKIKKEIKEIKKIPTEINNKDKLTESPSKSSPPVMKKVDELIKIYEKKSKDEKVNKTYIIKKKKERIYIPMEDSSFARLREKFENNDNEDKKSGKNGD